MRSGTTTERSRTQSSVQASLAGVSPSQLSRVLLKDTGGLWQDCQSAELVQFVIGEAHSPIVASKFYPALRFQNKNGKSITVPLSQIVAFEYNNIEDNT